MSEINTVIFDIGNVLTAFAWQEFFGTFGFSEEVLQRIYKATVQSQTWNEYDRGAMSDEELTDAFAANDPGIETELRRALSNISGMLKKYDYSIPWIKELKEKGYKVLVLSNFSHKAYVDCRDVLDFLDYVDGGILSFEYKLVKPEPEIYQALIDKYNLEPKKCVFLDDTEKNLLAAKRFGMHTVHFTNRESALEELELLGVI